MRKLRKGKINDKVMDMVARNYQQLQQLCADHIHGLYCAKSEDDIFHDTIIFVSQDKKASSLLCDRELIGYFCYRYRMILYQNINDDKLLKEIPYADYLQASKETEAE